MSRDTDRKRSYSRDRYKKRGRYGDNGRDENRDTGRKVEM